jgi:hypothetical protein
LESLVACYGQRQAENRNGFVVEAELRQASGMAERETAKDMVVRYSPGSSLDLQFGVPLRAAECLLTSIPWGYAHGRSTGRLATPCGPGSTPYASR